MVSSDSNTRALPSKRSAFLAGDFRDGAVGRQVAVEHGEVAVVLDRVVERPNDVWPGGIAAGPRQVLGDSRPVTVRQSPCSRPGVEQHLQQRRDPADGDQLGHQVLAARLQVREHRHAIADAREVVERELHARRVRDREQMQHGVGRAAERDDDGDGVLEGLRSGSRTGGCRA